VACVVHDIETLRNWWCDGSERVFHILCMRPAKAGNIQDRLEERTRECPQAGPEVHLKGRHSGHTHATDLEHVYKLQVVWV